MVIEASSGPRVHSPGCTAGKSELTPGRAVGLIAEILQTGCVGAAGIIAVEVAENAGAEEGAQAARKKPQSKGDRNFRRMFLLTHCAE